MDCIVCTNKITKIIYRCCDQNCCSKSCQVKLIQINSYLDPDFQNYETWIKSIPPLNQKNKFIAPIENKNKNNNECISPSIEPTSKTCSTITYLYNELFY